MEALDVEAADPREARVDGDVLDGDRLTGICDAAGDPLAEGETGRPTCPRSRPFVAARVRRGCSVSAR